VFSGIPVVNPEFQMLVNEFGYSDSMLDGRPNFLDREFLSGEWAGAIYYEGGHLPAMTRWLTDRFVFPDFVTPMPHFTSAYNPPFMGLGNNKDGFPVFTSKIMNSDVEIAMHYETVDFGASMAGRLSLGLAPQGAGGAGSSVPSTRYGFKQTYEIRNISGQSLSNVRFYQFLHTLHGDWGTYDARDYGGGMSAYRYGISLQGQSFGFDLETFETVKHTDTVAMKFSWNPSAVELGAFGNKLGGNHQTGEPAVGVHKSVVANSLDGTDFFDPDETKPEEDAWVAGALAFDIGSLAPDASVSLDAILAIHTDDEVIHPPLNLVIRDTKFADNTFTIDFEETTMNPRVGFSLRRSRLDDSPPENWDPVGVPYLVDVPMLNWRRFEVPVNPAVDRTLLFYVQPVIINED
jgi:hypothetical protein